MKSTRRRRIPGSRPRRPTAQPCRRPITSWTAVRRCGRLERTSRFCATAYMRTRPADLVRRSCGPAARLTSSADRLQLVAMARRRLGEHWSVRRALAPPHLLRRHDGAACRAGRGRARSRLDGRQWSADSARRHARGRGLRTWFADPVVWRFGVCPRARPQLVAMARCKLGGTMSRSPGATTTPASPDGTMAPGLPRRSWTRKEPSGRSAVVSRFCATARTRARASDLVRRSCGLAVRCMSSGSTPTGGDGKARVGRT